LLMMNSVAREQSKKQCNWSKSKKKKRRRMLYM